MVRKIANDIDLSNLAGGAVAEKFNLELDKVLANIADPNTDAKRNRTLTVKLTFKADENRDIATVGIETSSSLAPTKGVMTRLMLDRDRQGNVVGSELGATKSDPVLIESETTKVVGFNKI